MPFLLLRHLWLPHGLGWMVWLLLDPNPLAGITHKTAQQPKQYTDQEEQSYLRSGEIPFHNIDEGD
jgi:hypothetical protein